MANRSAVSLVLAGLVLGAAGPARAATLTVGPGKMYAKPCAAIAAAHAGDLVEVDAGAYDGDTCAWSTDNLTIRGVGGRARIDLTGVIPAQQKGIFTIAAPRATVENFELSGAAISVNAGNNGAGIRHQGTDLTVRNCYFHDNQNGILGSPTSAGTGTVLIERSEFANNGAGDGFSHNMYLGNYARFELRYSYSHGAKEGHLVKSRGHENHILYNRITDEAGTTASYEIDLPNGGNSYILGNLIEQGASTHNPNVIAYAEEGLPAGYESHLYVAHNTFLNNKASGTFVRDDSMTPAVIVNNIFWNGGTLCSQANAMLLGNFDSKQAGDPKFVDVANLDVHLTPGSPCIDKGVDPGTGMGMSLAPDSQYVHPLAFEPRGVAGAAIDVGAYEFGSPSNADMAMVSSPDLAESARDLSVGSVPGDNEAPGAAATGCNCRISAGRGSAGGGGQGLALVAGLLVALVCRTLRRERQLPQKLAKS